nr:hypothetical protein Iba_chr07fCG9770 [Ipomoea batatas]
MCAHTESTPGPNTKVRGYPQEQGILPSPLGNPLLPPKENIQTRARSQQAICHYIHPFSTSVARSEIPKFGGSGYHDAIPPLKCNKAKKSLVILCKILGTDGFPLHTYKWLQMNNPQPNSEPQHLCFYLSKPHVHIRQSSAQTCNRNQQSCFMPIKMVIHQPNSEQEASCSFAQDEQSSAHHQPGAELSLMSNCSSEHSLANPPPCRL